MCMVVPLHLLLALIELLSPATSASPTPRTIAERFQEPSGFHRVAVEPGSFGQWLRERPLLAEGSAVDLFNGLPKDRQDVHAGVLDLSVGHKDLQQCADAVIRLRAEYGFEAGVHQRINFHFTNGFLAEWDRWRKGERIRIDGNTRSWVKTGSTHTDHAELLRYLEVVFTYAGTRSLEKELSVSDPAKPRIGDVYIQGGSPGHAMLIVDLAAHPDGRLAIILAQSFMPAQQMHIVKNLLHPVHGAWFILQEDDHLYTPEWTFAWSSLRTWPEAD